MVVGCFRSSQVASNLRLVSSTLVDVPVDR